MSKRTNTPVPANASEPAIVAVTHVIKPARVVDPVLDHNTAKAVTPYRHEKSGKTVGNHQRVSDEVGAAVHLFSATGNFIATVKHEDAVPFEPAPKPTATVVEAPAASTPETPAAPVADDASETE